MKKLYTAKEAARILGFNVEYVRRLARKGEIRSSKAGRSIRFTQEQIDEFVKERE